MENSFAVGQESRKQPQGNVVDSSRKKHWDLSKEDQQKRDFLDEADEVFASATAIERNYSQYGDFRRSEDCVSDQDEKDSVACDNDGDDEEEEDEFVNPEAILDGALHHFGQSRLPDNGDTFDIDALLDKMLEENCKEIENELQRQIDEQIEEALQKQMDDQMEEYFRQENETGPSEEYNKSFNERKRSRDHQDTNAEIFEEHVLTQQLEELLHLGKGPPTIAEINADIQKVIDRYRYEECQKGGLS